MEARYKIGFFRALTGERGDMRDVNLRPPLVTDGLTLAQAEATKAELESWPVVATEFFIVRDDSPVT